MTKPVAKATIPATIPAMRAAPVGDERNAVLAEPGWFVGDMLTAEVFTFCGAVSELVMIVAVAVPEPEVIRVHLKDPDWPGARFPSVVERDWLVVSCPGSVIVTTTLLALYEPMLVTVPLISIVCPCEVWDGAVSVTESCVIEPGGL
jgi:hypothetical protein